MAKPPERIVKKRTSRRALGSAVASEAPNALPPIDYELEGAVSYLLARAGVYLAQAFSKQLKLFGLSLTEWRVCVALHHKPHQRLADLASLTSTDPSTLSRVVDGLMQRKLLVRDRSEEDARALALSLTATGSDLTQRIIPLAQLYERIALAGIPRDQIDCLKSMLRRMYDNMSVLDTSE